MWKIWEDFKDIRVFTHPDFVEYRIVVEGDNASSQWWDPSKGWGGMDRRDSGENALQRLAYQAHVGL